MPVTEATAPVGRGWAAQGVAPTNLQVRGPSPAGRTLVPHCCCILFDADNSSCTSNVHQTLRW